MSKLIRIMHPYELDVVKNVSSYLTLVKNILRICQRSGLREKKDGILIPVKWSAQRNRFVVDRGTSLKRDVIGLDLNNLDCFYSKEEHIYKAIKFTLKEIENESFFNLAKEYGIIKNTNKFIAFEYVNGKTNIVENEEESIYPIGLFKFVNCNKRKTSFTESSTSYKKSILLEDSDEFIKKLCCCSKNIKELKYFFINDYNDLYLNFLKQVKDLEISYEDKVKNTNFNLNFKSLIEKNTKFKKTFFLKDYKDSIKSKVIESAKVDLDVLFMLEMNIFFGKFIKEHFGMNSTEGFVLKDDVTNDFIKITSDFMIFVKSFSKQTQEEVNKDFSFNFLPGVF